MSTATATKASPNGAATPNTDEIASEHKTLAEALLAAQIAMPAVEPDATNPHFKSKFVSLGHLLSKVKPVLNRHGIVLVQAPAVGEGGVFVLRTVFMHAPSGESMEFDAPLKPTKDDPQGQGSAITYMRRYAAGAALAIADQEDDDGIEGSTRQPAAPRATAPERKANERPITGEQKGKINARLAAADLSAEEASAVRVWYCAEQGVSHFDRLPTKQASYLINQLREDGSGARGILDDLKVQASKGNEVAQKILARTEGTNA
jgi:ERF superfamily